MGQKSFLQPTLPAFVCRVKSSQAKKLLTLSKVNHWNFRVLGEAPYPQTSIYTGDYWIVPLEEEKEPIPQWVAKRAVAIMETGVPIQGFVVVHEALKVLEAKHQPLKPPKIPYEKLGRAAWVAAKVTAVAVALASMAVIAMMTSLAFMTGAVMLADPALIAVTEDGTWVLVACWER
jgi:hypothetical protein